MLVMHENVVPSSEVLPKVMNTKSELWKTILRSFRKKNLKRINNLVSSLVLFSIRLDPNINNK